MLVCEDMFRSVAFARDRWLCEGPSATVPSGDLEVKQLSVAVFLLSNQKVFKMRFHWDLDLFCNKSSPKGL